MKSQHGFTLIELSIVLVIVGILVGLGGSMIGPLMTMVKVRETRESMDANLQSVVSWASSNNKIPQVTEFSSTVAKNTHDAWARSFAFIYYSSIAPSSASKDTICGRRSTFLNISTLEPKVHVKNVACAIVSSADNSIFQSRINGVAITSGATSASEYRTITSTGPNSDLIRWITLDELRGKVGCQGAPLKILNNELPYANNSVPYTNATLIPDGGTSGAGKYGWQVTGSLPAGLTFNPAANAFTTVSGSTLAIQGTPTAQGSYFLTVKVSDSNGNTATKPFVLTVHPN